MRQVWINSVKLVALVIVAAALVLGGAYIGTARAASGSPSVAPQHAQTIVNRYLDILDKGMSTPACDFSEMATVYTTDARVTASGGPFAPGGPFGAGNAFGVQEFQGTQAITGFYTKLCHVLYHNGAVAPAWTQDSGFLLSPNVLNSFEHLSIGGHLTGRCMHVFTISGDHISSLDWAVYQ